MHVSIRDFMLSPSSSVPKLSDRTPGLGFQVQRDVLPKES